MIEPYHIVVKNYNLTSMGVNSENGIVKIFFSFPNLVDEFNPKKLLITVQNVAFEGKVQSDAFRKKVGVREALDKLKAEPIRPCLWLMRGVFWLF